MRSNSVHSHQPSDIPDITALFKGRSNIPAVAAAGGNSHPRAMLIFYCCLKTAILMNDTKRGHKARDSGNNPLATNLEHPTE